MPRLNTIIPEIFNKIDIRFNDKIINIITPAAIPTTQKIIKFLL